MKAEGKSGYGERPARRRPIDAGRVAALSSVAVVVGCGAGAARLLFAHAPPRTLVDRTQPLVVVTAWGPFGARCFWTLAATLAAATLALILALFILTRPSAASRHGASPGQGDANKGRGRNGTPATRSMKQRCDGSARIGVEVALAAAAAIGAAWAWPFVFSSDVYAYAAYGAMAWRGIDPYAPVGPHVHGALIDAARWQWGGTYPVCAYGPAFVALSELVVTVTSLGGGPAVGPGSGTLWSAATATTNGISVHGPAATLWALRALMAIAFLASIVAVDRLLRERTERSRLIAVAAYGLNPVALWVVSEGHNDALLLALFGAGLVLARYRAAGGAMLVGLSAAFKGTGALYAVALACDAVLFAARPRLRRLVSGALAGLCVAAAVSLPPLAIALAAVRKAGRYEPTASLQTLIGIGPALGLAMSAAAYGAARLRGHRRDGYVWFAIALWLALPNVYPWYALWVLPAIAAGGSGIAATALWFATILSTVRYLPDAVGAPPTTVERWAAAVALLPLLAALVALAPPRLKKATLPS